MVGAAVDMAVVDVLGGFRVLRLLPFKSLEVVSSTIDSDKI